jgi:hypothetical protein
VFAVESKVAGNVVEVLEISWTFVSVDGGAYSGPGLGDAAGASETGASVGLSVEAGGVVIAGVGGPAVGVTVTCTTAAVGRLVGDGDGACVGWLVDVGAPVGTSVGAAVGTCVGAGVGGTLP